LFWYESLNSISARGLTKEETLPSIESVLMVVQISSTDSHKNSLTTNSHREKLVWHFCYLDYDVPISFTPGLGLGHGIQHLIFAIDKDTSIPVGYVAQVCSI
jgi:hypothetical protein